MVLAAASLALAGCGSTADSGNPSCTAETDAQLCARLQKNCGSVTGADNCGTQRTVSCGTCGGSDTCGGGGTANVCGQAGGVENTNALCSDGIDNDGDGFIDCADYDCSRNPSVTVCPQTAAENTNALCSDGLDNDGDGYVDCADYDCSHNPAVTVCGSTSQPAVTTIPIATSAGASAAGYTSTAEVMALDAGLTPTGKYLLAGTIGGFTQPQHVFVARLTSGGTLDPTFGGGGVVVLTDVACTGAQVAKVASTAVNTFAAFSCGLWSVDTATDAVTFLDLASFGWPVGTDGTAAYFAKIPDPSQADFQPFTIERWTSPTTQDTAYGTGGSFSSATAIDPTVMWVPWYNIDVDSQGLVFGGANPANGAHHVMIARLTPAGVFDTTYGTNGFATDTATFQSTTALTGVATTTRGVCEVVDDYDTVPVRLALFPGAGSLAAVSTDLPTTIVSAFLEGHGSDGTLGLRAFESPSRSQAMVIARPSGSSGYTVTVYPGVDVAAGFFVSGQSYIAFGNVGLSTTPAAAVIKGPLP